MSKNLFRIEQPALSALKKVVDVLNKRKVAEVGFLENMVFLSAAELSLIRSVFEGKPGLPFTINQLDVQVGTAVEDSLPIRGHAKARSGYRLLRDLANFSGDVMKLEELGVKELGQLRSSEDFLKGYQAYFKGLRESDLRDALGPFGEKNYLVGKGIVWRLRAFLIHEGKLDRSLIDKEIDNFVQATRSW